jgi:hypothetical protein
MKDRLVWEDNIKINLKGLRLYLINVTVEIFTCSEYSYEQVGNSQEQGGRRRKFFPALLVFLFLEKLCRTGSLSKSSYGIPLS